MPTAERLHTETGGIIPCAPEGVRGPWSWVEEGRTFHLAKRVRRGPEEMRTSNPFGLVD